MLVILIFILIASLIMILVGVSVSTPRFDGPVTDHFDGSKFINPGGVKTKGGIDVLKWMMNRKPGQWQEDLTENYGKHPLSHYKDGIRITFVNHSTFLIQVSGLNILTDPVWSKRVSPFAWLGPKRMIPPGLKFEDLPRIHVLILSHNHYDHLDLQTVRMVFGAHHPRIIVPLGVKAFLEKEFISGVTEVDWWDEIAMENNVKCQAVPSQHPVAVYSTAMPRFGVGMSLKLMQEIFISPEIPDTTKSPLKILDHAVVL